MAGQEPESKRRIVTFTEGPGVTLKSTGWGAADGRTILDCNCGAHFSWPSDKENRWIPDRRHLNHCPGCGKAITGCEIPTKS